MKYIAIIHKDKESAYGVTLPDFSGCFAAADKWEDIPHAIQEAVECLAEGEEFEQPIASNTETIAALEDAKNGTLFEVDM